MLAALGIALVAVTVAGIAIGAVAVPVDRVVAIIGHNVVGRPASVTWLPVQDQIVWDFRVPRVLLATAVGAGLALVGAVLQALVRNPLADPYLLGVSSGASLGAVMVLVLGSAAVGGASLSVAAFVGSLGALATVYFLAQQRGRLSTSKLILAGVAMAYLFQAAYSFLIQKAQVGRQAEAVLYWLLGSLSGARWTTIGVPIAVIVVGAAILLLRHRSNLNALLAGEEAAVTLGVNLTALRAELFILTSLLVGVMVAATGAIAFVGLIVPHAVRMVVGADHRRLLPAVALAGAVFMQLVDLVARTADQPQELPLSIVTAAVGVPFFIWLLRSQDRSTRLSVS